MARESGRYEALWPRGRKTIPDTPLAKRLDTLQGKTVCELWDWAFRGDVLFPAVEKELTKRYSGVKFVGYDTFGSTHSGDEAAVLAALPGKLRQNGCDAVISGMGC